MISLKKYLDSPSTSPHAMDERHIDGVASKAIAAFRSALMQMGNCSLDACPGLGNGLKIQLDELGATLTCEMEYRALAETDRGIQEQLRNWGQGAARHYQKKSDEVKELLIAMAQTAEAVSARDQRCAGQFNEVTTRLTAIASLEDLTEIRASIKKSAAELKTSIERMNVEGKAAIERLQGQVSTYRMKLEEAEESASRDALTGLRNRLFAERQIERSIAAGIGFCVAIVDIDEFKKVNDEHGHLTGDQLLKQFAAELVSACRSSDVTGRWGGDEFIILLECRLPEATAQLERLHKWICGDYLVESKFGSLKVQVRASIGLAEYLPNEAMKDILARADAEMYRRKSTAKTNPGGSRN
jgi:diguanylate cyclase